MPINRSPPPMTSHAASSTPLFMSPLHLSMSEPNIREPEVANIDCDFSTITHRTKRRCVEAPTEYENQLSNFMADMRSMFNELKEDQINKIDKIYDSMQEIKLQNVQIQETVSSLSEFYDNMKSKIDELEIKIDTERKNNAVYTKSLEDKLEKMEKAARSTCVEIRNIPVVKSETKECLLNNIVKVGAILNAPIQPHEINDIYRVGPTESINRTIIVNFTTTLKKEKFLRSYKTYNKGKSNNGKLSTEHLKINGTPKPVFISENLTAKLKRLLFLAKDFASSNNYQFCWVTNGKIFLREKEGAPQILIKTESDIPKVISMK